MLVVVAKLLITMVASEFVSVPSEIEDLETEADIASFHSPKAPWKMGSKMLAFVVGIAMSGMAVVAVVSKRVGHTEVDHVYAISQLSATDPCAEKPQIKITELVHANLGKVADPTKPEGLVFSGTNLHPGHDSKKVLVIINATNADTVAESQTNHNGIWGEYLGIAAKGGKYVHADFEIVDAETRDPVILRELDITWFDLDRHSNGAESEYVRMKKPANNKFQYWLTKNTLVTATEEDEYYRFSATVDGSAADNPKDPLLLTAEQKDKAVTVRMEDVDKFSVELGSSGETKGTRGFIFVFRPSLLCAKTVGGGETELETGISTTRATTEATTPTTSGTTTTAKEKECWFTIPVLNICVPKFLPFL